MGGEQTVNSIYRLIWKLIVKKYLNKTVNFSNNFSPLFIILNSCSHFKLAGKEFGKNNCSLVAISTYWYLWYQYVW